MIYADTRINWIFPYEVIYEDEDILILKELPREHKCNMQSKIDRWITILGNATDIFIGDKRKALEIQD